MPLQDDWENNGHHFYMDSVTFLNMEKLPTPICIDLRNCMFIR